MPGNFRRLTALFALAAAVIVAVAVWAWRVQRAQLRRQVEADLSVVASLKVEQIVAWRHERIGDAGVLMDSPFFVPAAERFLDAPDREDPKPLLARFRALQVYRDQGDIALTDEHGTIRLSVSGVRGQLHAKAMEALAEALREHGPVLTDLHAGPGGAPLHTDVVAPLLRADGTLMGAVVLRSDAAGFLLPMLQAWPTSSDTAESLLVRREGDGVVFLSKLRHLAEPPLQLRIPLTRTDVPAVLAAEGREGVVDGRDYRGVAVVAVIRPVPGSKWLLIAKEDTDEAFAAWRSRSMLTITLTLALVSALGAALGLVAQRNSKAHFRALFEAEAARLRSEQRYRTTLLSVGDGVIGTDPTGRVELMNPVAEQLTGWTQEEALGRDLTDVFRVLVEETRKPGPNPVEQVSRDGTVRGMVNHTLLIARDGSERPIAETSAPIRDEKGKLIGVVLVFRDQTDERQGARELQAERDNLAAIMSASPVAMVVLDSGAKLAAANRAAAAQFVVEPGQLVGKTLGAALGCACCRQASQGCGHAPECTTCAIPGAIQDAINGGKGVKDRELLLHRETAAGPVETWLRLSVEPIEREGGSGGAVAALADITERKRAEQEQNQLRAKLFESQKMESVGRLAGGVAHDFNNLLAVIVGNADLAFAQAPAGSRLQANLADIRHASDRATTLIRQLLAFSRRQVLRPDIINLNSVVLGVERLLRTALGETIRLDLQLADDLGHVTADPTQMEQVLMNLAVNARDAMPDGGTLLIKTERVALPDNTAPAPQGGTPGQYVMLTATDTGFGMDEDTKAHLFEPFYTTKEPGKGTGLGMSTVYGTVSQSGGLIGVESEPGKGTSVRICLPSQRTAPPPATRPPSCGENPTGSETVLVVEDEDIVRQLVVTVLETAGYEVLQAASGPEALRMCGTRATPVDLLLTDVMMPEMNGKELAVHLQRACPEAVVVYMSGCAENVIAHHGILEPGTRFISKPFRTNELSRLVREALDSRTR